MRCSCGVLLSGGGGPAGLQWACASTKGSTGQHHMERHRLCSCRTSRHSPAEPIRIPSRPVTPRPPCPCAADDNFVRMVMGKLGPQQAFLMRKLKIQGSMGLAMKLQPILVGGWVGAERGAEVHGGGSSLLGKGEVCAGVQRVLPCMHATVHLIAGMPLLLLLLQDAAAPKAKL